jgi:hypothetical protein
VILNMHQDKCVNKHWWILKMDYKRQTAVLSVIFVLVGMMFIVPAITEKAMALLVARADGKCGTTPCHFRLVGYGIAIRGGKYLDTPTRDGTVVTWSAHRTILFPTPIVSGIEGFVNYAVGNVHVIFHFNSPFIGPNSCKIVIHPSVPGSHTACDKGSGLNPKYFYFIELPNPASGSGGSNSGSDSGDDNGEDSSGENGDNGN